MKFKKIISAVMTMFMTVSTVTAFSAFADDDETGNDEFSAIEVTSGELMPATGTYAIDIGYDHDWYKFSLDTPSKVNFSVVLSNVSHYYSKEALFYEIIDHSNDDAVIFKCYDLQPITYKDVIYLSAGDYYIHFADTERRQSCNYKFLIESTPTEESFESLSNNNIGNASPIEFDKEYIGQISLNDISDYYTFDVAEEGRVDFNFESSSSLQNVDWKIYNSENEAVQSGTLTKKGSDDKISVTKSYVLTAGTFTLVFEKNKTQNSDSNNVIDKSYCGNYTFSLDYIKDYNNIAVSDVFATADVNKDHKIDANDAANILAYYAYLSTGGTETDMNIWMETMFANS